MSIYSHNRTARVLILQAGLAFLALGLGCRNPVTSLHDFQSEIRLKGFTGSGLSKESSAHKLLEQALDDSGLEWSLIEDMKNKQNPRQYRATLWESGLGSKEIFITLIQGISAKDPKLELAANDLPYNLLRYANRVHRKLVKKLEKQVESDEGIQVKDKIVKGKANPIIPPGTQIW